MYIKSFDDVEIYYSKQISPTNKETILFVHGGFHGNHTRLKYMMKYLENKFNFLTPDLRGRGDSGFPEDVNTVGLEDYAKDLYEIVEKENIESLYLLGVSFGGLVALKFAQMYSDKVKKIVIISSAHRLDKLRKRTRMAAMLYQPLANAIFSVFNSNEERRKKHIDYSSIDGSLLELKYGMKIVKNNSAKTMALRYEMMKAAKKYKLTKNQLRSIKQEILVIYGRRDFFFPLKVQKQLLHNTNSTLKVVQNAGHNLYITHAEEVADFIKKFI